MKKIVKVTLAIAISTATSFASINSASAQWRAPTPQLSSNIIEVGHIKKRRNRNGEAIALGIIGLAAGAIIAGSIAEENRRQTKRRNHRRYKRHHNRHTKRNHDRYYTEEERHSDYFPPAPRRKKQRVVYSGQFEPWSNGWYRVCASKYRSFDPARGTYLGYDGKNHFCIASRR